MLPHDEAGSGPPIVLIHSGVTDRRMWSDHLEPLGAAGYRVVAIDLPGFGDAELPPGEQAPWQDVLGAMDISDFLDGAKAMAEQISNAQLEVIEQAGHLAPLETPERFRELLLGFLRSSE